MVGMAGRKTERSRKVMNYSKLTADGMCSDKDDDDDFMDTTPSNKRKKLKKNPNPTNSERINKEEKQKERKARNRLSDEEKYQKQLEEALKMSLVDSEPLRPLSQDAECSRNSTPSEQDTQNSCIVQADVLHSPNTKLLKSRKPQIDPDVELRKGSIVNGAALSTKDEITRDVVEDIKETGRRKSVRNKIKKDKDEEEFEIRDESESEDELSVDEESDESDYEETPEKKSKLKKKLTEEKKVVAKKDPPVKNPPITTISRPPVIKLQNKENKPPLEISRSLKTNVTLKTTLPPKPISTTSTLPRTPKSISNVLPRRSPANPLNSGRFIQRGWTPPGPAGSNSSILKSPQSPNFVRVGLSRNVKLPPLHPRLK